MRFAGSSPDFSIFCDIKDHLNGASIFIDISHLPLLSGKPVVSFSHLLMIFDFVFVFVLVLFFVLVLVLVFFFLFV